MTQNTTLALAKKIAEIASDKKAQDLVVLDLQKVTSFTDYFIICSGGSERQVQAIADSIAAEMKKDGHRLIGEEGKRNARWILLDFGDVIVHVFYGDERKLYDLERLWHDAKVVPFKEKIKKTVVKRKEKSQLKTKKKSKAKKKTK